MYYWGTMQWFVDKLGAPLRLLLGTTVCESMATASNIFFGLSDTTLMIRPFIKVGIFLLCLFVTARQKNNKIIFHVLLSGYMNCQKNPTQVDVLSCCFRYCRVCVCGWEHVVLPEIKIVFLKCFIILSFCGFYSFPHQKQIIIFFVFSFRVVVAVLLAVLLVMSVFDSIWIACPSDILLCHSCRWCTSRLHKFWRWSGPFDNVQHNGCTGRIMFQQIVLSRNRGEQNRRRELSNGKIVSAVVFFFLQILMTLNSIISAARMINADVSKFSKYTPTI